MGRLHNILAGFLLMALCVSCAPAASGKLAGSPPPGSPQSSPSPADKKEHPQSPSLSMTMPNNYELPLKPGIDLELQRQLENGRITYPILAFTQPPDSDQRGRMTGSGIELGDVIADSTYFARVIPGALDALQMLVDRGDITAAVSLPPEAKISLDLAEMLQTADPGSEIEIMLRLFEAPSPGQNQALTQHVDIFEESPGPIYLIHGTTTLESLEPLASLPIVRQIEQPQLSSVGG